MMEIRVFKDDNTLESETILTIASPEVVNIYTGFDIFWGDYDYTYMFENRLPDDIVIEFEWVEDEYPYWDIKDHWNSQSININKNPTMAKWLKRYETRPLLNNDYVILNKIRFPKISKISRGVFFHKGVFFDEIDSINLEEVN